MITQARPELRQPVADFADKLAAGVRAIPLIELAALFGAPADLMDLVRKRGDIALKDTTFTNDGPEIVVPAGMVELEVPMILRGQWVASNGGFALSFPMAEFAPRACAQIAILRKCFELKELRASANTLELDFDNEMVDRRYTF